MSTPTVALLHRPCTDGFEGVLWDADGSFIGPVTAPTVDALHEAARDALEAGTPLGSWEATALYPDHEEALR